MPGLREDFLKIEGKYSIAAPRDRVFDLLRDPHLLRECIPNCEQLTEVSPGRYEATIRAGIGAIRGSFTGHVQIADVQSPNTYRLLVEGSGTPGHVKGDALVTLTDATSGTDVSVDGDGQVGGMIAGVGQRMLLPAARSMMNQFFGCMKDKIEAMVGG